MILLHEAVDTLTVDKYMLDLKKFLRDFEHFDPAIWSFQRSDFQAKDWKKKNSAQNVLISLHFLKKFAIETDSISLESEPEVVVVLKLAGNF